MSNPWDITLPVLDFFLNLTLLDIVILGISIAVGFAFWHFFKLHIKAKFAQYRAENEMLVGFLERLIRYIGIFIITAIFISIFFDSNALTAFMATVGLGIGMSLKNTLGNIAGAIFMMVTKPAKKGDYISIGGHSGTVEGVYPFITELRTSDNLLISIPSSKIMSEVLVNYTAYTNRRVDELINLDIRSDAKKAIKEAKQVMMRDERIENKTEIAAFVESISNGVIVLHVRFWLNRADLAEGKSDILLDIQQALMEPEAGVIFAEPPIRTITA